MALTRQTVLHHEIWLYMAAFVALAVGARLLTQSLQVLLGRMSRQQVRLLGKSSWNALTVGAFLGGLNASRIVVQLTGLVFLNAGLMNSLQALWLNVAAGFAALWVFWLLALVSQMDAILGSVFWGLGVLSFLNFSFKWSRVLKNFGFLCLSLALILFGFESVELTRETWAAFLEAFLGSWLVDRSSVSLLAFIAVGGVLTLVSQSRMVVMVFAMAGLQAELIKPASAVAMGLGSSFCLGAELFWQSFKLNKKSQQVALTYWLSGSIWALFVVATLPDLCSYLSTAGWGQQPIFLFLIVEVVVQLGFFVLAAPLQQLCFRWSEGILPIEGKEPQKLQFIRFPASLPVDMAVEQGYQENQKLAAMIQTMMSLVSHFYEGLLKKTSQAALDNESRELHDRLVKYEKITDNIKAEMNVFLGQVIQRPLTEAQAKEVQKLWRISDELENIADQCKRAVQQVFQIEVRTKEIDEALVAGQKVLERVADQYGDIFSELTGQAKVKISELQDKWQAIEEALSDLKKPQPNEFLGGLSKNLEALAFHSLNLIEIFRQEKGLVKISDRFNKEIR